VNRRTLTAVLAFALGAGAIASGVLSEASGAREARLAALLEEIVAAEERAPYVATGVVSVPGSPDRRYRVWSHAGRKRVEPLQTNGRGALEAAAIPLFLRPGSAVRLRRVKDSDLAARNYEVVRSGRDRVAGIDAEVIELRARHPGRASYRLSVSAASRFPLRFEVMSAEGRTLDARFESIEFDPEFGKDTFGGSARPTWFRVEHEEVSAAEASRRAGFPILEPSRLPAGFEIRRAEIHRVRAEVPAKLREMVEILKLAPERLDVPVIHLNYTDGMAALSVVQCSARSPLREVIRRFIPAERDGSGRSVAQRFSDRNGTVYLLETPEALVLLAGNLPAGELEPVLRSLSPQGSDIPSR
jgi:hypothetical protein